MKRASFAVLAILLLAGASFGQYLNNPKVIATSGALSRWSSVAFGPDGVLHCVYDADPAGQTNHFIWYVRYDGQTASTPVNLGGEDRCQQPQIHVGPSGYIAVVWGAGGDDEIFVRTFDPSRGGDSTRVSDWSEPFEVWEGDGQDEPAVAVDLHNDIHVFWWDGNDGRTWARSRFNGVWENPHRLNNPNNMRASQGCLNVGPDGTLWAVWREKQSIGGGMMAYKVWYSKRLPGQWWTTPLKMTDGGNSFSNPWIAVNPVDGVAGVAVRDLSEEGPAEVIYARLIGDRPPRELAISTVVQHSCRIGYTRDGVAHIATQLGGGDYGDGALYTNNEGGTWKAPQVNSGSMPKVPGLAVEDYGNVAVCWVNYKSSNNNTDIWINTKYPVVTKYFLAPQNLTSSIKFKGGSKAPSATYSLNWNANPKNNDDYLQGYQIYVSENGGEYQLVQTVSKSTFSLQLTYQDLSKKRKFGIATVSTAGAKSEIVPFS